VSHAPIVTATSDARPRLSLLWQTAFSVRCALKPKGQSLQLRWDVICKVRAEAEETVEHQRIKQHRTAFRQLKLTFGLL
jgi:hypothetical protein